MRVRRRDLGAFLAIVLLLLCLLALVGPGLQWAGSGSSEPSFAAPLLAMRRSIRIFDPAPEPAPPSVPAIDAPAAPPRPKRAAPATKGQSHLASAPVVAHATPPDVSPPSPPENLVRAPSADGSVALARSASSDDASPVSQAPRMQQAGGATVEVTASKERVKLVWRASPGEVVYRILNGNGKPIGMTAATTFVIARSSNDECYRIQAIDRDDRISKLSRAACVAGLMTPLAGGGAP